MSVLLLLRDDLVFTNYCTVLTTGQFVSFLLKNHSNQAIPFVAAIIVTAASRLYAQRRKKERPLVYMIAGLLVLVPG